MMAIGPFSSEKTQGDGTAIEVDVIKFCDSSAVNESDISGFNIGSGGAKINEIVSLKSNKKTIS